MTKEITDWRDPSQVTADDFYILPDSNIYVEGYGYLTDHIDPQHRRDRKEHWNSQFENPEAFQKEWKPRSGPIELVYNLATQKGKEGEKLTVASLGAGLGDFTSDLSLIPNTRISHVDFSQQANQIAQTRVEKHGNPKQVQIFTETNSAFLERQNKNGEGFDVVFIYGGLGENTPLERDIEKTLTLATEALNQGGHLWYVCLEQPFLLGEGDTRAQDILGEFPPSPQLVKDVFGNIPEMHLVKEVQEERPDKHPLRSGGPDEQHMHIIRRSVYSKELGGKKVETPKFDFKDAKRVNPNWEETWSSLVKPK